MIPIQALLSRLRHDEQFARGRWEIAYLDRTQPALVRLPFEDVRTRAHIGFVFDVVDEEGVTFRSHLDGSIHRFTPEVAMAVQASLGSDVAVAFDQPVFPSSPRAVVAEATARTHRWADRSLAAHRRPDQALFGIVQGGLEPDLRAESTRFIADRPFDGICIGGLAGDETPVQRDGKSGSDNPRKSPGGRSGPSLDRSASIISTSSKRSSIMARAARSARVSS